jgi:hypothetical protein
VDEPAVDSLRRQTQRARMKSALAPKLSRKSAKNRRAAGKPAARPSLFDRFKAFDGRADDLPADLAAQHDHYLYGLPKRAAR